MEINQYKHLLLFPFYKNMYIKSKKEKRKKKKEGLKQKVGSDQSNNRVPRLTHSLNSGITN